VGCTGACLLLMKEMLDSSQLGACEPPYSLVHDPRDLAYAQMNNNYMMQYESLMHKLCYNRSKKGIHLLLYKVFMHFYLWLCWFNNLVKH
jgi:hypothetical protein